MGKIQSATFNNGKIQFVYVIISKDKIQTAEIISVPVICLCISAMKHIYNQHLATVPRKLNIYTFLNMIRIYVNWTLNVSLLDFC